MASLAQAEVVHVVCQGLFRFGCGSQHNTYCTSCEKGPSVEFKFTNQLPLSAVMVGAADKVRVACATDAINGESIMARTATDDDMYLALRMSAVVIFLIYAYTILYISPVKLNIVAVTPVELEVPEEDSCICTRFFRSLLSASMVMPFEVLLVSKIS